MDKVRLTTNFGDIVVELDRDKAPVTVDNFLQYVKDGHYDNTLFHRVIDGFMVQGGGMEPGMKQKATRKTIAHEGANGLKNKKYTLAMARTGDPHSASSQFFINIADNKRLDFQSADARGYGYTVFGKVVDGMDVVNKIAAAPTGPGGPFPTDVPKEHVMINSAKVLAQ